MRKGRFTEEQMFATIREPDREPAALRADDVGPGASASTANLRLVAPRCAGVSGLRPLTSIANRFLVTLRHLNCWPLAQYSEVPGRHYHSPIERRGSYFRIVKLLPLRRTQYALKTIKNNPDSWSIN
jgi:hypothetical protein